jgi:hypothetical protein
MTKRDKGKLKMAFLFLISDGKVTKDKYDVFDGIGKSIGDFKEMRRKIINSCLGIFAGNLTKCSEKQRFTTIKSAILSIAKDELLYYNKPSKTQLECFWMLISLAYNRGELTANKKAILKEVCETWGIKMATAAEMMDTAEAIISIADNKKWLNSPTEEGGFLSSLLHGKKNFPVSNAAVNSELDKNQEELLKSINLLIEDDAEPLDEDDEDAEEDDEDEDDDDDEDDDYELEEDDDENDDDIQKPVEDKDWIEGEDEKEEDDDEEDEEDDGDDESKDIWK